MANDTQRILDAIESIKGDHEKRIRNLEVTVSGQGLKLTAVITVIMAFGGIAWNVIKDTLKGVFP